MGRTEDAGTVMFDSSLIRYSNPILIHTDSQPTKSKLLKSNKHTKQTLTSPKSPSSPKSKSPILSPRSPKSASSADDLLQEHDPKVLSPKSITSPKSLTSQRSGRSPSKKAKEEKDGENEQQDVEEILNRILPPREWKDENNYWVQYVSPDPATPQDVIKLQEDLDVQLKEQGAQESGLCPIREELYLDCFKEIIRQVTIECSERGELLNLVKDDIEERVRTFQKLYESGLAFGIRKALFATERKLELETSVAGLKQAIEQGKERVEQLKRETEEQKSNFERITAEEAEKHKQAATEIRQMNDQLRENLESMLAAPRK